MGAMCGGNTTFAYYLEPETNVVLVSNGESYGSERSSLENATQAVIESVAFSGLDTVRASPWLHEPVSTGSQQSKHVPYLIEPSFPRFQREAKGGLGYLLQQMHIKCKDMGHHNKKSIRPLATMARLQYKLNASTCSEISKFCAEGFSSTSAHILCPEACGCGSATSGNPFKSESYGCPMEDCMMRPSFFRDNLACEDLHADKVS